MPMLSNATTQQALNDAIWQLREEVARADTSGDTSQLCSAALFGSGKEKAVARRKVGKILARRARGEEVSL